MTTTRSAALKIRYGRARCPKCSAWYDIDEGHLCPSAQLAAAVLPPAVVDAAELPDAARPHPAGLTWCVPLTPRPIPPAAGQDRPELRPALALDAVRFFHGARHGLAIGRALIDLEEGSIWYAIAPDMRRAPERLTYLVQATKAWTEAITAYAKEIASWDSSTTSTAVL